MIEYDLYEKCYLYDRVARAAQTPWPVTVIKIGPKRIKVAFGHGVKNPRSEGYWINERNLVRNYGETNG